MRNEGGGFAAFIPLFPFFLWKEVPRRGRKLALEAG